MSQIYIDNNHTENASKRMWKYCQNEQFCDVVLIAGPKGIRIPAHRNVLCATSDYFETMFTSSFDESTAKEVALHDVDGEVVKELVQYCYTGRIEIKEDNVEKLLEAADSLLLHFVVNACGDFLAEQLHPNNCLGFSLLAERHHCEWLLKKSKDYSYKHFENLYTTEEFLGLNAMQLSQLLESDHLNIQAEEDVFRSLMAWLEHNRSEREQYMDDLFKLLRMPLINSSFLEEHVKPECTSSAGLQLYHAATEWNLLPKAEKLNTTTSTKPRLFNKLLMATRSDFHGKFIIMYLCPLRLKWMECVTKVTLRHDCSTAVMENNLFILGGRNTSYQSVNTVICLNLRTMTSKYITPMDTYRAFVTTAVIKGILFVVGGTNLRGITKNNVDKWNLKTEEWSVVSPIPGTRSKFGCAVLNDKLYVIGGCNATDEITSTKWQELSSAEYYDPEENLWTSIAPMNGARQSPGVAVVNGMLYAVGGENNRTIECYDPKIDKWTLICYIKEELIYHKCAVIYDKLFLIGSELVVEYNPLINEWKVNNSMIGYDGCDHYFWYSGELLASKFREIN